MIESMINRDSTRHLISALESLSILTVYSFTETSEFVEVLFKVNEESKLVWLGLIERLVGIHEKISICKKYILRQGKLNFTWSLQVASKNIDVIVDEIALLIKTHIAKTNIEKTNQNKKINKIKKSAIKKPLINPIYQDPEAKVTVWEIEMHTSADRNKPRILEDGSMSTKGAFTLDSKGKREWAKALSYRTKQGQIR